MRRLALHEPHRRSPDAATRLGPYPGGAALVPRWRQAPYCGTDRAEATPIAGPDGKPLCEATRRNGAPTDAHGPNLPAMPATIGAPSLPTGPAARPPGTHTPRPCGPPEPPALPPSLRGAQVNSMDDERMRGSPCPRRGAQPNPMDDERMRGSPWCHSRCPCAGESRAIPARGSPCGGVQGNPMDDERVRGSPWHSRSGSPSARESMVSRQMPLRGGVQVMSWRVPARGGVQAKPNSKTQVLGWRGESENRNPKSENRKWKSDDDLTNRKMEIQIRRRVGDSRSGNPNPRVARRMALRQSKSEDTKATWKTGNRFPTTSRRMTNRNSKSRGGQATRQTETGIPGTARRIGQPESRTEPLAHDLAIHFRTWQLARNVLP